VRHQQEGLDRAFTGRLPTQVLEAVDLQRDAFQKGEREEEPGLVAGEPAPEAGTVHGLLAGEDEDVGFDVGILVDVIGVGVVAVVLVVPPPVAHPEQQIAVDESDQAAHPPVASDLGVPRVVAYEGRAGGQHGEQRGQEQHPPGVTDQGDARHDADQGQSVDGDGERVPALSAVEETLSLDGAQEWCELASGRDPGWGIRDGCGSLGHGGTPVFGGTG
jgi:hypothetical protein